MAIALSKLENIQLTQGHHTADLREIKVGVNAHLKTLAENSTKQSTYLENIAETNAALVKNSRWSVPIIGFVMVIAVLGAVIVFEKMGDGGKAKFSGSGVELERGSNKPPVPQINQ